VAALERQLAKGGLSALSQDDQRGALRDRSRKDRGGEEVRRHFVLRTNTDLNPLEAMLFYKQLWMVEQTFRTAKPLFSTRPIFHKLDETIHGHVFCSFALVLKLELEERIAGLGGAGSWPEIIADLDSLIETEYDGKRFIVRDDVQNLSLCAGRPATSSRCKTLKMRQQRSPEPASL
jgi:hypothetical protein